MAVRKKKTNGCESCKKKPPITKLPDIIEIEEIYAPSIEDIKLAYIELGSKTFTDEKKAFIDKIYESIFGEKFDWGCRTCVNAQVRRFHNYIRLDLKLEV